MTAKFLSPSDRAGLSATFDRLVEKFASKPKKLKAAQTTRRAYQL